MAAPIEKKPPASPMNHDGAPPESWRPLHRLARRAMVPVENFLSIEASSGILLLAAAAAALVLANSPLRGIYDALWRLPFGLRLGPFAFERDLRFWINDGVMTIFFFVIGLEIRREMHHGELSNLRRATLPLAAAIGGMAVPACIFISLNLGHDSIRGWGIPMATDIAFAVGVLTLLGKRVPATLRVLLLTLAVIDDVGAILVIAIFYSSGLEVSGFLVLAAGLLMILAMQALGVRNPWAYVIPAAIAWAGAYFAGIHPTLVGVVVGLMTPVRAWYGREKFIEQAEVSVSALRERTTDDESAWLPHLERLNRARQEAVSPVERLEYALHGWVAFGAMPLFALANAGVPLGAASFSGEPLLIFLGVAGGLVLGKPIGILLFSWLATRLGMTELPRGVTWPELGVIGAVAGIGFTMSLFIAGLAFPNGTNLDDSKLGILVGSGAAAALAFLLGRIILPSKPPTGIAATAGEAERTGSG